MPEKRQKLNSDMRISPNNNYNQGEIVISPVKIPVQAQFDITCQLISSSWEFAKIVWQNVRRLYVYVAFQKCCVENKKYIIRNRIFMLGCKITVKSEIFAGD